MKQDLRKTVIVDELQEKLARRIVIYWGVTWLLVFTLPIMVRMFTEQVPFNELATQIVKDFWFPIFISVFLIPIVVWDSFRFSNRIAGPIMRVSRHVKRMANQQPVEAIRTRQDDFCNDLIDNVNMLIELNSNNSGQPSSRKNESLEPIA